jgi:2-desacetyl-2-hydroxyethyl bacteriochlorophyllide A dehydrogenase
MKAVVLTERRQHELLEVPEPEPAPDEVIVQPDYCGICGSDLHAPELTWHFLSGVIAGHEFAGRIVETGTDVDQWSVGQRVTINPNGNVCHECVFCKTGRYNLCPRGTQDNAIGVRRNGGMAEFVALHTSYLHLLPDAVTTSAGAWTEPLAVAVRAVRTAPVRVGDAVAVIGAGPIGQLVLQVSRKAGARDLLVIEPFAFRRQLAIELGAERALSPDGARDALGEEDLTFFDQVFECSGHPQALELALRLVAPGGTIRVIGLSPTPSAFDTALAITKEVQILGGHIYIDEFPMAIGLLAAGDIDVGRLTTATMPLEQVADAFAALREPESTMKVLLQTSSTSPA